MADTAKKKDGKKQRSAEGVYLLTSADIPVGTHDFFEAKIGEETYPLEVTVTPEMVKNNCFATDNYNPWFLKESPFGGPVASPTFLTPLEGHLTWGYWAHPAGGAVNAGQEYEFLNPLKVGKKATMRVKLVARYKKRGRTYCEFEITIVDEDGLPILRGKRTRAMPILRSEEERPKKLFSDPTAFNPLAKPLAKRSMKAGDELEPLVKNVTLDKSRLYHAWPFVRNQHSDYPVSHALGLSEPIIAGNMCYEFICEMMLRFFGKGFYTEGKMAFKVIRKMPTENVITTKAVITGKVAEGDAVRLMMDVWCENAKGQKVVVGNASGLVH